jgi:hypothetical protein
MDDPQTGTPMAAPAARNRRPAHGSNLAALAQTYVVVHAAVSPATPANLYRFLRIIDRAVVPEAGQYKR